MTRLRIASRVAGWNYDAAGNQTRVQTSSGGWQHYQYDAANRLVRVRANDINGTVISSYTYGDTNQRLITEEAGQVVVPYYVADGGATLAEYEESGSATTPAWSKSYIYLGARLLSTLIPNGSGGTRAQYHHPDRLGTRVVTGTDGSSNPTSFEQVTLPFGTALNNESTGATTRRFTSYDRSATTGLDYALNRHYDPLQGRFTQVDPIGACAASLSEPQSWNMYAYVAIDPINRTDPSGLFWGKLFKWISKALKWVGIAVLVATAVITVAGAIFGIAAVKIWLATTTLGKIVGFVSSIPTLIGGFIGSVGKTIAGVFSFAGAGGVSAVVAARIGYGVLLGGSAAAGAVASHLQKKKRKQAQRGKGTSTPNVPVLPPLFPPPYEPRNPNEGYGNESCGEYDRAGRRDLGTRCRTFGDFYLFKCVRKCLLDSFGTGPGGQRGRPGEYREPLNLPWPLGGTYGPLTHAKCFAKCSAENYPKVYG